MSAQKKVNKTQQSVTPLSQSDLGLEINNKNIAGAGVSIYIRKLLQNWRQGTVGVKGRSEVSYSNRKPWKQKGTGRARAGSARSPLWRGGGIIFGPQPRERELKIPKKLRQGVFNTILYQYLQNGKIYTLPCRFFGKYRSTYNAINI
jgi:large subunit ribosomal protein L4